MEVKEIPWVGVRTSEEFAQRFTESTILFARGK